MAKLSTASSSSTPVHCNSSAPTMVQRERKRVAITPLISPPAAPAIDITVRISAAWVVESP